MITRPGPSGPGPINPRTDDRQEMAAVIRPDARVHFDPNTGRLNVTLDGSPNGADHITVVIVRFEYPSGSSSETTIRASKQRD